MNSMDLLKAFSDINEEFLSEDYGVDRSKVNKDKEVKYNILYKKKLNIVRFLNQCVAICIILFLIIMCGDKLNFKTNNKENLKDEICINNYLIKSSYSDFRRRMDNRRNS